MHTEIMWAVRAYREWRNHRISDKEKFDPNIFEADIDRVDSLTQANLAYSLCCFIPEVTKVNDVSPYPGATLYQLVIALQRFLTENDIN